MSTIDNRFQARYKGRFMKQKELDKRLKSVVVMAEGKKLRQKQRNEAKSGRRIVEIDELAKNLTCSRCQKDILLRNIVSETQLGLNSILSIKCEKCYTLTNVNTGKKYTSEDGVESSDVNKKLVLGAVQAGIDFSCLNKILTCLNIPNFSPELFERYEREVGPMIEEAAKDSCDQAAEEESRLVVENVEKLCEEL